MKVTIFAPDELMPKVENLRKEAEDAELIAKNVISTQVGKPVFQTRRQIEGASDIPLDDDCYGIYIGGDVERLEIYGNEGLAFPESVLKDLDEFNRWVLGVIHTAMSPRSEIEDEKAED